jgi:ammonia channel protein AmtB
MLVGAVIAVLAYKLHYWVERRFKIDDAVGAVAVHGYAGFLGVVAAGILLWGYPSSPDPSFARITPWGNFIGAVIMFWVLGFIPGYIAARILHAFKLLRIPREVEIAGLDISAELVREEEARDVAEAQREAARAASVAA